MSKSEDINEAIGRVFTSMHDVFSTELFAKTEAELEEYWFFKFDHKIALEHNLYKFHDLLDLYGDFCRRWEEHHNGSCCVVERVRDKYLMPKIRQMVKDIKRR